MQCEYDACTCPVEEGLAHCGPSCRQNIQVKGDRCLCGHAACSATEGNG